MYNASFSDAKDYYKNALRIGQRTFSRDKKNLPSLDHVIKHMNILNEMNLGEMDIPLKKIIGTLSYLRSNSFSSDYMPLSPMDTEFCDKWVHLAQYHLNEGISDPIKVYEYLGYYYVIEGNKRVSVLKFFKSFSIRAEVIRLINRKNLKSKSNAIYLEYIDFFNKTKINFIWFSRIGRFKELYDIFKDAEVHYSLYKSTEEISLSDKYKYLEGIYLRFRKVYHEVGGGEILITTGDAFLEYIKLYGIPDEISDDNLKKILRKLLLDIESMSRRKSVKLVKRPEQMKNHTNVITSLSNMMSSFKKLNILFIYEDRLEDSEWAKLHERSRIFVQNSFGDKIETSYIENIKIGNEIYQTLMEIWDDYDYIFTTSPSYINDTLKVAIEKGNGKKIFNCSCTHFLKYVSTYWGRMYEPRFLCGIIAGAMTKTNKIGIIESFPIPDVINSLNSFALGARFVNPYAKIILRWSNEWRIGDKSLCLWDELLNEDIDMIYSKNLFNIDKKAEFKEFLCTSTWNFDLFYEKIIYNLITIRDSSLNFWWGIDSGVVDIHMDEKKIPYETLKTVHVLRSQIKSGFFNPFTGVLKDNRGNIILKEDIEASNNQILFMDFLSEGIEGEMPIINI
ncbi:MAG: BMP family ABC transporter substrate-binding protein [Oscillospiraceae bacterium]|nr:BMP family ABC transporter substrate-binding protein [Oscillospiraceae bacterium]